MFPSNPAISKEIRAQLHQNYTKNFGVWATPHDPRRIIAEGLDISGYSLKRLLNHTTGDVTQGYVILNMDRLRGLMEKISKFIEDQRPA